LEPVSTIVAFLASCAPALTAPTLENLGVLVRGALLATGPRTVTGCLSAAWPWVTKHVSAYENVLRRARLSLPVLGRTLFRLALALVAPDGVLLLVVDESLVRRYGPFVPGVGMHRDSVRSSRGRNQVTPGHKWVTVGLVVRLPFMGRPVALPVFTVLYTAAKRAKRNRREPWHREHRTVAETALLMVRWVVRWAPERRFRLVGDGAYGTHDLADAFRAASRIASLRRVRLVSRFQFDGATFAPPPPYAGRGRPRVKGEQLPSPAAVAADPATAWETVTVEWYGARRKEVALCSRTGLWYRKGSEATPLRWVVVRDPERKRRDEVFFTTEVELAVREIVEIFVCRWSIETTFQEARSLLGLETLRNWTVESVRRSVPLLLGLYSFIVVWFAQHVEAPETCRRDTPWYKKVSVTFSDMLATARKDVQNEALSGRSGPKTDESKVAASLLSLVDSSFTPISIRA